MKIARYDCAHLFVSKDHYVAQTYLRHFGDAAVDGMLHGYKRSDGSKFQCWPRDVCHEWDGDRNPALEHHPELFGPPPLNKLSWL